MHAEVVIAYLLSLTLRLLCLCAVIPAFVAQYVLPSLRNSLEPLAARDPVRLLERLLKLSLPVTYVWVSGVCDTVRTTFYYLPRPSTPSSTPLHSLLLRR